MTHTLTPPAQQYGNGGFGRPSDEPTVAFRPRPRFVAPVPSAPPVWGPPAPIPPMAPPQPSPWGVPNAWAPPAPWGMPPAGGQSPKAQRWLLAVAGVAVAVAAITVAVAASSAGHNDSPAIPGGVPVPAPPTKSSAPTTPSAPVAPPHVRAIGDDALPTLLPDPAYVGQVMGSTGLESIDKLSGPGMFTDQADPAQCVGLVIPANENAYAGSGSRATYVQALHDQSRTTVFNAVTTFGTASMAGDLVAQQATTWQTCRSAPIVLGPAHDHPTTWTVEDVSRHGSTVTARVSAAGGPTCQRAMTSKNNVVIDVTTCNANPANEAVTLASAIAKRVAQ
ncbi:sensor domain-containing protein [Mycobacterium sp.]|uniref:sensor domain-containing protein n=1 Tax=Mycobacterium sp. TaxID=1785 RepID=UPI003C739324